MKVCRALFDAIAPLRIFKNMLAYKSTAVFIREYNSACICSVKFVMLSKTVT